MPQQMFPRPRRFKRRTRSRKRPFSSSQVKAIKKLSVATQDMKQIFGSLSTGNLLTSTSYYLSVEALDILNGTADGNRVGDRITVKDFEFRTQINLPNPLSALAHYNIRVLIVQFPEKANVDQFKALVPEMFLPSLQGGPTSTPGYVKYKILHNQIITVAPFAPHKTLVHRVNAKDLMMKDLEYALSSPSLPQEIIQGDIYYFLVPDVNTVIVGGELSASTTSRLRYYG